MKLKIEKKESEEGTENSYIYNTTFIKKMYKNIMMCKESQLHCSF